MTFYDFERCRVRWFLYCDILGTRALIEQGKMARVFDSYRIATERMLRGFGRGVGLRNAWFSDSFVVWTDDDGGRSFLWIELFARSFFFELIMREIPLRGAISCGEVYSEPERQILFGPGLIEAYEYGEDQDWIGLVLTPSAERRMEYLGVSPSALSNYARFGVARHRKKPDGDNLYACILGGWIQVNGRNPLAESLESMARKVTDSEVAKKYERTICFLKANKRMLALDS